jgi:hypothetical protein
LLLHSCRGFAGPRRIGISAGQRLDNRAFQSSYEGLGRDWVSSPSADG